MSVVDSSWVAYSLNQMRGKREQLMDVVRELDASVARLERWETSPLTRVERERIEDLLEVQTGKPVLW